MKKYILTEKDMEILKYTAHSTTKALTELNPKAKFIYESMEAGYLTCLSMIDFMYEGSDDNSNHGKN